MEIVINRLGTLRRLAQKLGPYLMLEILLPGGTLLALLVFFFRSRKWNIGTDMQWSALAVKRALVGISSMFVLRKCYLRSSPTLHSRARWAEIARNACMQ